jgi:hypothetical protein
MGNINVGRVILGGLLAGLVMTVSEYVLNTYVVAEEMNSVLERLGLAQIGTNQIIGFIILTFLLGIVLVWVYAGFRPRFGAGIKTAIIAGITIWILGLLSSIGEVITGIVSADVLIVPAIWSLVEIVVASIVGAWVYREA